MVPRYADIEAGILQKELRNDRHLQTNLDDTLVSPWLIGKLNLLE
jgi:hypothetical protein